MVGKLERKSLYNVQRTGGDVGLSRIDEAKNRKLKRLSEGRDRREAYRPTLSRLLNHLGSNLELGESVVIDRGIATIQSFDIKQGRVNASGFKGAPNISVTNLYDQLVTSGRIFTLQ